MTPSGWHNDATNRDGAHEAMHLDFWRWLSSLTNRQPPKAEYFSAADDGWERFVCFEWPIPQLRSPRIAAFADVAEVFQRSSVQHRAGLLRLVLYEIKPQIITIGGILRQCAAVEHAAKAWASDRIQIIESRVVVPHDDPKADALAELINCVKWDSKHKVVWP